MISEFIKDTIHKIIRKNNLPNLILGFANPKSSFLEDYIDKLKKLLNEDMKLNPGSPKKYILYVQYLKEEFTDLDDEKLDELLIKLFDLYTIPKKRNNFYLIFLLYYYLNEHNKSEEKILFKMIYFYYIIIVYRNRFPLDIRQKLVNIDTIKFEPLHKIVQNKIFLFFLDINKLLIKYKVYYLFIFLSLGFVFFYFAPNHMGADINGSGFSNDDVQKTLLNSMVFFTPSQDYINGILGKSNSTLYFLGFMAIIFFLQVFRDVIKNTIINENLQHIVGIFKKIFHIIFYVYNSFINFFTTKFILYVITFVLRFNVNITGLFLFVFMIFYWFVYLLIVGIYLFAFAWLFHLNFLFGYIYHISIVISLILMGINMMSDYKNFENFVIGIDGFLSYAKKKS